MLLTEKQKLAVLSFVMTGLWTSSTLVALDRGSGVAHPA